MTDLRANRQSPSRRCRIPVRDASGALLGFVDAGAATSAVHRGQAVWRAREGEVHHNNGGGQPRRMDDAAVNRGRAATWPPLWEAAET